jgi:hypothetical protein
MDVGIESNGNGAAEALSLEHQNYHRLCGKQKHP